MIRYFVCIALLTLLCSCSILPEWLGESEGAKLEGERLFVLKVESQIQVDRTIEGVKVLVPKPRFNTRWYKSNGYHMLTYPNPSLPEKLDDITKVSVGKGGEKGQHLNATPVVANGMVFTLDGYGKVSAFDAENIKKQLWTSKVKVGKDRGNFSNGGISYYEGRIYVTSGGNQVVALNASTGEEVWRRTIQSIARAAPAVRDGRIYVNTINNRLYALDSVSGGIVWTHTGVAEEISMLGSASPVVSNNIVLSPYSSGELYALRGDDGSQLWFDSLIGDALNTTYSLMDIDASPVVSQGKVFIVSNDGVLAATDLLTGARVWEQEISGTQPPWVVADFLYIIGNKKQLVSVYTPTGGVKWIAQLPEYEKEEKQKDEIHWSGPVMAGNRLLVVGSHGKLLVLSAVTGAVKSTYKVPDDIFLPPVVAHDTVYLLTNDAELVAMKGEEITRSQSEESHDSGDAVKKPSMFRKMLSKLGRDKEEQPDESAGE